MKIYLLDSFFFLFRILSRTKNIVPSSYPHPRLLSRGLQLQFARGVTRILGHNRWRTISGILKRSSKFTPRNRLDRRDQRSRMDENLNFFLPYNIHGI